MARFLSLHTLHALPASLLNRDDANATKTIAYGGTTRVRVSSQSWKRAMRTHMREAGVKGGAFGSRTKQLPALLTTELATAHGRDPDVASAKVAVVLAGLGLSPHKSGSTAAHTFLAGNTVTDLGALINAEWDDIESKAAPALIDHAKSAFDVGATIDLAMFGRMLTEIDKGALNVDGACSVSHAFSVDAARIAPDFYTAVDDEAGPGDAVTPNLGVTDLSAPVLYRHAALNVDQLTTNLQLSGTQKAGVSQAAIEAFINAFVLSTPSAKRNSTAATTLPSVVLAVLSGRDTSMADGFAAAINSADTLTTSIETLFDHAARVVNFLPNAEVFILPVGVPATNLPSWAGQPINQAATLTELADNVDAFLD